ncbi:MAG: ribosome biogenesis GTP-binding protein YihA/YsxC [Flammeovirgaceae bacterium]
MMIKSAKFVISNQDYQKCPVTDKPEYAFIGRSNVGKSSLINALTNHKDLAKTSSTPGKTQLINHFLINDEWFLVDLPGYGYARVSKDKRIEFKNMIYQYLQNRKNLMSTFVLIDIRLEPQKIDLEFIRWMGEHALPFALVFTKSDKLSKQKIQDSVNIYKKTLLEEWEELPTMFITSAEKKEGLTEMINYIEEINKSQKN